MTLPRRCLRGTTYMVQRRCNSRRFFLTPGKVVNEVFRYCMALAASESGVVLHCYCVMPTHYHIVLTDPGAELPTFMRLLNQLVALCLNRHLGRSGHIWETEKYSAVQLEGEEAVIQKMTYTLANPVAAGLVSRSDDWVGARSRPEEIGGPGEFVKSPGFFFRADQELPLKLERPPVFADDTAEEVRRRFRDKLEATESGLRRDARLAGREFKEPEEILEQDPHSSYREQDRTALRTDSTRSQLVACADADRRKQLLEEFREFVGAYRAALADFVRGLKAMFPRGTYWMRVFFRAPCETTA